ncbi:MAG: 50S ribosomal protein L22 [Candidatus Saccharimonadales bacterium]
MPVKAIAKGVNISPRKVGVVAGLVRDRSVADAIIILEHTPRRSAIAVSKVIKSAQANAEHNHNYRPDSLYLTEISVTAGPRLKRYRPVSRGMAHPYIKRSSHIRVVVEGEKREIKKPATKANSKAPAKSATKPSKENK